MEVETEDVMNMNSFESAPKRQKMHLDVEAAEELGTDEVAIIFSFLSHQDIMRARVCRAWRQAAKKAIVHSRFVFKSNSLKSYNAMRAMSIALPNFQRMKVFFFEGEVVGSDSDSDSDQEIDISDEDANYVVATILPNFTKLRSLEIMEFMLLQDIDPALSNFPLLQTLKISCGWQLDLETLSALPLLKELELSLNRSQRLNGNLISLRSLKDTLEKLIAYGIEGDFMTLADFPRLKKLGLGDGVTGDIRDIRVHDFPALEVISLPSTVKGGYEYDFQRISDVPSFMQALQFLLRRTPTLFKEHRIDGNCHYHNGLGLDWRLSQNSPDRYGDIQRDWANESRTEIIPSSPPFNLQLIHKGSRLGWSWYGCGYSSIGEYTRSSCEINWLDPESKQNEDVERFDETCILHSEHVDVEINFFRGYHEPPNELEYRRLCDG